MAKTTGLGAAFYASGYDLGGDIQSVPRIGGGPSPIDVTDITQSAHSRLGGKRDGGINLVVYFDPATVANGDPYNGAHLVYGALPTTDTLATYFHAPAIGSIAASCNAKQIGYNPTRGTDGSLTVAVDSQANGYGLEWGVQLTAGKRTDTTPTAGTSYDQTTVSTSFGWQAYLHVFSVTGTSVTVTVEDSADNLTFAPLTGGAFTAVAAPGPGWQRLAGASNATVRRYVRTTTTGTFTNAAFAVMFVRNLTAVTF